MKKLILIGVAMTLGLASLTATAETIEVKECGKCPMRIRFAPDGKSATINKARLMDDNPSAEELARRVDAMKARAEKLLIKDDPNKGALTRPLMGWSSWNTFGEHISEEIILGVAQAMATNGLKDAGYVYVNTDDGFFKGHGPDGKLGINPKRFPNGLKPVADGIHALGMKAGIYSDTGKDTCGSIGGGDQGGRNGGLYGHDAEDCKFHFNDIGFDFIKVDNCGGKAMKLDVRQRYTEIANAIKATGRTDVRFNICCAVFPGTWAADIAGSWRTTGDIRANWNSIRNIIRENLYLSAYVKPGHYNDMDMLEVGQLKGVLKTAFNEEGLTKDEELTHFGVWCIMSSPLLLGCDPRTMPESSFDLATNPYLIAMNQNDLGLGAYVAARNGDVYVLVKDADEKFGKARYVGLINLSDKPADIKICARDLDLAGRIDVLDLVERADLGSFTGETVVEVPAHGAKFYRFDAEERLDRVVYEAETAFLTDYQELWERGLWKGDYTTARPFATGGASGGMAVGNLGCVESNDLIWKDVKVSQAGDYELALDCVPAKEDRHAFLQIDDGEKIRLDIKAGESRFVATVKLSAGVHTVRLSNPTSVAPNFDRMTVTKK